MKDLPVETNFARAGINCPLVVESFQRFRRCPDGLPRGRNRAAHQSQGRPAVQAQEPDSDAGEFSIFKILPPPVNQKLERILKSSRAARRND